MKRFNKLIQLLLAAIMIVMVVLTFYQVIMRYVFNNTPSWTEEVVRFLFVWASLVGAAIGIQEKAHIGIDVVVNLFPKRLQEFVSILVHALIAAFGGIVLYYSIPVISITANQKAPATGLKMSYVYLSTLVFGVLCILYAAKEILATCRRRKKGSDDAC